MRPIRVLRLSEIPAIGPGGRPVVMIRAEFMVGELGPFTHQVDKEKYQPAVFRTELENIGRGHDQVAGPPAV